MCHTSTLQTHTHANKGAGETYSSWPVQPQEALHVSSSHQLQQNEARQDVETDADAAHNVVMAELTEKTNSEKHLG